MRALCRLSKTNIRKASDIVILYKHFCLFCFLEKILYLCTATENIKIMIKPIKPSEIVQIIPEWVIAGANECIKEHYRELTKESHFTQDELVDFILKNAPEDVTSQTLFDNHWLDIEPIYRKAGWKVEYDKPGYCETYDANFTFTI